MNGSGQPPDRVPTLTEVVLWPDALSAPQPLAPANEALPLEADVVVPVMHAAERAAPVAASMNDEQMIQRVLDNLQRQIELMLEYRLREMLTPILTRAADGVIRDARAELASTLRDVVARAVAQELSRHRDR
jgi:hypothetical protein